MEFRFHVPFIIVATIVGFIISRKTGLPSYLRWLPHFLLLTSILELFAWQMVANGKRTTIYYNFYSIITFIYFSYILHQLIRSRWMKQIIAISMVVYPIIALINIFFIQGLHVFHTMSYSIGAFFTIIFCVYFFYELFRIPHSVNLKVHPGFWIVTGLLFFNACTLPFIGLANYIAQFSQVFINNFQDLISVLNVLLYLLITIAFLCRINFQRSMS